MKSGPGGCSYREDPDHEYQTEQVIAAETRFRLVVEAAPNAMVMINRAGEIVMVNAQAERVFGYSRAELPGQPVEMLVPERRAEAALNESQIRLQELHAELLQVSRLSAIGQMAAMVTHELNQPLTAINNYMEAVGALLERGGDIPLAGLRSAVERAAKQAIRAGQIIQRLRGLVSHGDSEKRIEPISPLVKEAVELVLLGAKHRGVNIRVVQDDLGDVTVVGDKIQIQQVLLNLLRNANELSRNLGDDD
jgi:PAS domain S-box-containing protein